MKVRGLEELGRSGGAKGRSSCPNCMLEYCNISLRSQMKPLEGFKYSMYTKLESKHVFRQSKSVSTSGQQPQEVGPVTILKVQSPWC